MRHGSKAASGRSLLIAAAAVTTAVGLSVVGPPPAAHAESGYRVCGVYASSSAPTRGGIGTGLAVKVSKSGKDTCGAKIREMERDYGRAYPGSTAGYHYRMVTCEDWVERMGDPETDICPDLRKDAIYSVASPADLLHPADAVTFSLFRG